MAVQETPVSDDDDDDLEDCEEDEEEDPTLTAYAAATTVTLDTIYVSVVFLAMFGSLNQQFFIGS